MAKKLVTHATTRLLKYTCVFLFSGVQVRVRHHVGPLGHGQPGDPAHQRHDQTRPAQQVGAQRARKVRRGLIKKGLKGLSVVILKNGGKHFL